jgi:hypothetical protein
MPLMRVFTRRAHDKSVTREFLFYTQGIKWLGLDDTFPIVSVGYHFRSASSASTNKCHVVLLSPVSYLNIGSSHVLSESGRP